MINEINAIKEIIDTAREHCSELITYSDIFDVCFDNNIKDIDSFKKDFFAPFVNKGYIDSIRGTRDLKVNESFYFIDFSEVNWDKFNDSVSDFQKLGTYYLEKKAILNGEISFDNIFVERPFSVKGDLTEDRNYSDIEFTKSKDQDLEENLQKPQPSNEDTELVEMVCDWMDLEKIHKYNSMTGELIPKIDRFKQLFKKYNEEE